MTANRLSISCRMVCRGLLHAAAAFLVVLLAACTSTPGPEKSEGILDAVYREARYSSYLDELSAQMIVDFPGSIISQYGQQLADHRIMSADELTIENDLFWGAFLGGRYSFPSVYFSRVLLLMKEGRLDQAQNTVMLGFPISFFNLKPESGDYEEYILGTKDDLIEIFGYIDKYYYSGVSLSDSGDWEESIEEFDRVLADFPHSCPSQNGKAISLHSWGMEEMDPEKLMESGIQMDSAREDNPFYWAAYQNHRERDTLMPLVRYAALPKLQEIANWETRGEVAPEIFVSFASDCLAIDAPEYAVFALMYVVDMAFVQYAVEGHLDGFDIDALANGISSILFDMGMPISAETGMSVIPMMFQQRQ